MKTAISIPDPIFQSAERAARRLGISRSELYTTAVERFLRDHGDEAITKALNRVYGEERSGLDSVPERIRSASLVRDEGW